MRRYGFFGATFAMTLAIGLVSYSSSARAERLPWDPRHYGDHARDCYPLLPLWTAFGPQLHYVNVCSPRRFGYGYGFPSGYSYSMWGWGW